MYCKYVAVMHCRFHTVSHVTGAHAWKMVPMHLWCKGTDTRRECIKEKSEAGGAEKRKGAHRVTDTFSPPRVTSLPSGLDLHMHPPVAFGKWNDHSRSGLNSHHRYATVPLSCGLRFASVIHACSGVNLSVQKRCKPHHSPFHMPHHFTKMQAKRTGAKGDWAFDARSAPHRFATSEI